MWERGCSTISLVPRLCGNEAALPLASFPGRVGTRLLYHGLLLTGRVTYKPLLEWVCPWSLLTGRVTYKPLLEWVCPWSLLTGRVTYKPLLEWYAPGHYLIAHLTAFVSVVKSKGASFATGSDLVAHSSSFAFQVGSRLQSHAE